MGTPIAGRVSKVHISTDGGSTYNLLAGVIDASLNATIDEIETTDHDSTTREYIPNFVDITMDLTLNWEEDDAIQTALLGVTIPTPVAFKCYFWLNSGAGNVRFEADAFSTSYSVSGGNDGAAELSCSWRLSNTTVGTTV